MAGALQPSALPFHGRGHFGPRGDLAASLRADLSHAHGFLVRSSSWQSRPKKWRWHGFKQDLLAISRCLRTSEAVVKRSPGSREAEELVEKPLGQEVHRSVEVPWC